MTARDIGTCRWVAAVVAAGVIETQAVGAVFDPGPSTAVVTHKPGPNTGGFADVSTVIGGANWNVGNSFPTPTKPTTVFPNAPDDSSRAAGNIEHYTLPGPVTSFANIAFPYGMGVGQTDLNQSTFQGDSEMLVPFDMMWDLSDGYTGPMFAYQFLGITLKSKGTGSASVDGVFNYELKVQGSADVNKTLDYNAAVNGVTTQTFFLFAFDLLCVSSIAAGTTSSLRIHGDLTFKAQYPFGEADSFLTTNPSDIEDFLKTRLPEVSESADPNVLTLLRLQGGGVAPNAVPEPSAGLVCMALGILLVLRWHLQHPNYL